MVFKFTDCRVEEKNKWKDFACRYENRKPHQNFILGKQTFLKFCKHQIRKFLGSFRKSTAVRKTATEGPIAAQETTTAEFIYPLRELKAA